MIILGPPPPKLMTAEQQRDGYERVRKAVDELDVDGFSLPTLEEVAERAGIADRDTVRWLFIQVLADKTELEHRMECVSCGHEFDPIRYRWLCPTCKTKNSCCEGEPL